MNNKIKYLMLCFLFMSPSLSFGQKDFQYWEFGIFGGMSTYSGDLTDGPIDAKHIHGAYGIVSRFNANKYITLKINAYFGEVSGDDANSSQYKKRLRNLHFKSEMLDFGANFEYNLSGFNAMSFKNKYSPYVFIGLSLFRFSPMAEYNGEWIPLQPIGTEGQGSSKYNERQKYALTQISVPFGFGYKMILGKRMTLGLEAGFRKTFTDYIDDVSKTYVEKTILEATHGNLSYKLSNRTGEVLGETIDYTYEDARGNPTKNDWYHFTGITLTYNILPNTCFRF